MMVLQWDTTDGASASRGLRSRHMNVTAQAGSVIAPPWAAEWGDPSDDAALGRVQDRDARRQDDLEPDLDE
jgi:hypothetical protein